jgi:YqjK-like protein
VARSSEIERLEDRRRLLLAESGRLRRQLGTEIGHLQAATRWLQNSYTLLQSVRPYWPLVVAAAGFLFTRKGRGPLNALDRIWSVWKIAKRLIRVFREYSTASPPKAQEG